MTGYTPGPWFVDPDREGAVSAKTNLQLAMIPKRLGGTRQATEERRAEAKANAMVISLTPEMVDALRDVLKASQKAQDIMDRLEGRK